MIKIRSFISLATILTIGATWQVSAAEDATEYQYGSITALLGGDYSAKTSVAKVIENGGTFGLGAGVGIGEVVAVEGDFYLAGPYGKASKMSGPDGLSYMTATNFSADKSLELDLNKGTTIADLQTMILAKVGNNQIMYAIKVSGDFSNILARSEDRDFDSSTPIVEWMKVHQHKYTFENVKGSLVMFYTPEYSIGIGVPGFHTHYLSDDKKIAGHVLNATVSNARIEIQAMHNLNIRLGPVENKSEKVSTAGLHELENVGH